MFINIARIRAIVKRLTIIYAKHTEGGMSMIVYNRLWDTMKRKGISQYKLIKDFGISSGQLDRIRKGGNINMYTLNALCRILECAVEDIIEYIADET